MKTTDFWVIGAGIMGLTTAISLQKRGYQVQVLHSRQIPDPLAASTDISKIVRMEYGSDGEYMDMAAAAIEGWKEWNELFGETLYHEVGFLLACQQAMTVEAQPFEWHSYQQLQQRNFRPFRLKQTEHPLSERFPAFAPGRFPDGFFHAQAGFAEASRTLEVLAKYATELGVVLHADQEVRELERTDQQLIGIKTHRGDYFPAHQAIVCAGNFTPYLLPELQAYFRITGHPVFHLEAERPALYAAERFPVFGADISRTGWYGFPAHPKSGLLKVARHSTGLRLDPVRDERTVHEAEIRQLRTFLADCLPGLADSPIVHTRRCLYTDTLDGHFWISRHPTVRGLTVGSGGSGHGFKMGPIIGEMIAETALGNPHGWSDRYDWRVLAADTAGLEEARAGDG